MKTFWLSGKTSYHFQPAWLSLMFPGIYICKALWAFDSSSLPPSLEDLVKVPVERAWPLDAECTQRITEEITLSLGALDRFEIMTFGIMQLTYAPVLCGDRRPVIAVPRRWVSICSCLQKPSAHCGFHAVRSKYAVCVSFFKIYNALQQWWHWWFFFSETEQTASFEKKLSLTRNRLSRIWYGFLWLHGVPLKMCQSGRVICKPSFQRWRIPFPGLK